MGLIARSIVVPLPTSIRSEGFALTEYNQMYEGVPHAGLLEVVTKHPRKGGTPLQSHPTQWLQAASFEKFTAAWIARLKKKIEQLVKWNEVAFIYVLQVEKKQLVTKYCWDFSAFHGGIPNCFYTP